MRVHLGSDTGLTLAVAMKGANTMSCKALTPLPRKTCTNVYGLLSPRSCFRSDASSVSESYACVKPCARVSVIAVIASTCCVSSSPSKQRGTSSSKPASCSSVCGPCAAKRILLSLLPVCVKSLVRVLMTKSLQAQVNVGISKSQSHTPTRHGADESRQRMSRDLSHASRTP